MSIRDICHAPPEQHAKTEGRVFVLVSSLPKCVLPAGGDNVAISIIKQMRQMWVGVGGGGGDIKDVILLL